MELQEFKPEANHITEGDCIEFIFSNDDYYAEWVCDNLTIYCRRSDDKVIGSCISGIKKLKKNFTLGELK